MHRRLFAFALILALGERADAATYLVNTTADTFDNVCDVANCSLKDAVYEAEQTPVADTIDLQEGATYTITSFANNINAFAVINTPIHIDGRGSTIKHGPLLGVVRYFRVGPTGDLSLTNLTVRDGAAANDFGSVIRSEGTLTIDNCQFYDNVNNWSAGAIYNEGASTVITRSTFVGNKSLRGGALYLFGLASNPQTVVIDDCSFQANKALTTTSAIGGAISLYGDMTATISDSTFVGNTSDVVGGAIAFQAIPNTYTVDLVNLTITGNTANGPGGGIFLSNCTGPTCPIVGQPRLTNVILANNLDTTITNSPNCGGYFVSVGHNIIGGPNNSCAITAPLNPPDYSVSTLTGLGPIVDNGDGGGIFTPPTATCQAVDTGDGTLSAPVDQLALGRVGASSDVGAIEHRACVPPPTGMIDWWHFDETVGTVAFDIAGTAANNGVHQSGVATTTKGVAGRARCFNGVNQRTTVADDPELDFAGNCALGSADPFTIDAWVKTFASGRQPILDKRQSAPNFLRGYGLFILNGKLGFQMATGTGNAVCGSAGSACEEYIAPGPNLLDNRWHHVAVVVSRCPSATGTLYVDGYAVYSFTPLTGDLANTAGLLIGDNYPTGGAPTFRGCLDEVEIFRRDLGATEIEALYQAGWAGKCKPPGTEIGSSPVGGCVNGVIHGVHSVGTATGKMIHRCTQDRANHKLGGMTTQACLTADRGGKIAKASAKAASEETKKCEDVVVRAGPDGVETGLAALGTEMLALVSDLFGHDLDTSIATRPAELDAVRCQDTVVKGAQKIFGAKLKIFEVCVKKLFRLATPPTAAQIASCIGDVTQPYSIATAMGPAGKLGSVVAKFESTVTAKCGGVNVPAWFPSACAAADLTTLGQCVEARIECRVCRMLAHGNRLVVDCDAFDDGLANASCAS